MKKLAILLIALLCSVPHLWAQEEALAPLGSAYWRALNQTKGNDTAVLQLPFFDDFSNYTGQPNPRKWLTRDAFVNCDYALFPPTIGVITLDALNGNGALHATATSSLFSGDTLASQIVRLDSLISPTRQKLLPSDSVYLSFYYLPGGGTGPLWERLGDSPNPGDSLILELFDGEQWRQVWAIDGPKNDSTYDSTHSTWQYVTIAITDPSFFHRRFQFRFRNYCSLDDNAKPGMVGNCDQWNLDYIYLSHGRRQNDRNSFRDVAFVQRAPRMLERYYTMPAWQYRPSDMANHMDITISNLYNSTLSTHYFYHVYDANNQAIDQYDGGYDNCVSFPNTGSYQTASAHAHPSINFAFPTSADTQSFRIVHVVKEGNSGDNHVGNDTTIFYQHFSNYFAYDDGVPENGYGLVTTSSRSYLAYRFILNQPDTLTAIDMLFNHTRNEENAGLAFYLSIWEGNDSLPGALIYRDEIKQRINFNEVRSNGFIRYLLASPLVISDSVFIGIEQLGTTYLNIGFDRSNDRRNDICYRTTANWQTSILGGCLTMRPCFGSSALVGIEQLSVTNPSITLYPNPATSVLNIECSEISEHTSIQIYNHTGRLIWQGPYSPTLSLNEWPSGLYLMRITDANTGISTAKKFIVK